MGRGDGLVVLKETVLPEVLCFQVQSSAAPSVTAEQGNSQKQTKANQKQNPSSWANSQPAQQQTCLPVALCSSPGTCHLHINNILHFLYFSLLHLLCSTLATGGARHQTWDLMDLMTAIPK